MQREKLIDVKITMSKEDREKLKYCCYNLLENLQEDIEELGLDPMYLDLGYCDPELNDTLVDLKNALVNMGY